MSLLVSKREKCMKTSVSIPGDVRRRAASFARSCRRSLSWYVTSLIEKDMAERSAGRGRST